MNYDHAYHAGNFADVFKHIILIALLQSMKKKSAPFCYLETHAGKGIYDLTSTPSQKGKEYTLGIEKLYQQKDAPSLIQTYLDVVAHVNQDKHHNIKELQYYPGSPLIAKHFLRANDRIIACELKKETHDQLKNLFKSDTQAAVHHLDGWLALKAFLPPAEKRGMILIDPSYENPNELTHILNALTFSLKKFQQGIYAIWYPIKDPNPIIRFHQNIAKIAQSVLVLELSIYANMPHHFNGCGIILINPPYQLEEEMDTTLSWLWKSLTINNKGQFIIKRLK